MTATQTLYSAVALSVLAFAPAARADWQELKSKHFIVRFEEDRDFAERVRREAERCYGAILRDLGYRRHGNFWLWSNRTRLILHGSREEFLRATGAPAWASGKTSFTTREITGYRGSERFIESVLPHELTHLVFRDFLGPLGRVPLWLEEGVAQWEERAGRAAIRRRALTLLRQRRLAPLRTLTAQDVREEPRLREASAFYVQAAGLVGYLIEEHGSQQFRKLCGQLRDGKSLEDALRFTYPASLRNMAGLESAWLAHVAGTAAAGATQTDETGSDARRPHGGGTP